MKDIIKYDLTIYHNVTAPLQYLNIGVPFFVFGIVYFSII